MKKVKRKPKVFVVQEAELKNGKLVWRGMSENDEVIIRRVWNG